MNPSFANMLLKHVTALEGVAEAGIEGFHFVQ